MGHLRKRGSVSWIRSVHQSWAGWHPTEGIGFSPEAFGDGFVLHGILARGLQFNPQAPDACQMVAVFFGSAPVDHAGSMRRLRIT